MSSSIPFPQHSKLWLIGGTSESVTLAKQLQHHRVPLIVTVTTDSACNNYPQSPEISIQKQRFIDDESLAEWIYHFKITGVLDASHPFATEISQRAMRVSAKLALSYLRFERASVTAVQSQQITEIEQGTKSLSRDFLQGKRVLLTVGSQALAQFARWQDCADLFARILPSESALKMAYQAGFSRDRLIALQPPLSFELECALWQHWRISLVITKASGHAGGEDIKRHVAEALQIPLLIIKRPSIDYPWKTQSIQTAIHFGQKVTHFAKQNS